jgi:hypothetical protein
VPRALSQRKSGSIVGLKQCSFSGRAGILSENDTNMSDRSNILLFKAFGREEKMVR